MKRIVIDPGHGGWDTGSTPVDIGQGGYYEATFTWRLAQALGDYLLATYQVEIRYTHQGEYTSVWPTNNLAAELAGRCHVANAWPADLLLSLHHDSTGNRAVRGGSLWIWMNQQGPLRWYGAQGNHTDPKSYPIASQMVGSVRDTLAGLGVPWRWWGDPEGVACSNFGVLRNTNGPAVLVECFHGSNEEDCAAARRPEFIPQLAKVIGDALGAALGLPKKAPTWPPDYVEVILPPTPDDPKQQLRVVAGVLRDNTTWVSLPDGLEVPLRAVAWVGGRTTRWIPAQGTEPHKAIVE